MLKALLVLEIFNFCPKLCGQVEQLIQYTYCPNKRSKGNQKLKFGQQIEYNMRNIRFEKSYTKCCGETSSRFYKKSKLSISLVR